MANRKVRVKYSCRRCGNSIEAEYGVKDVMGGADLLTPCFACADREEWRPMRGEILDIEKTNKCKTCKQEYLIKLGDIGKNRLFCGDCIKAEEATHLPKVQPKPAAEVLTKA